MMHAYSQDACRDSPRRRPGRRSRESDESVGPTRPAASSGEAARTRPGVPGSEINQPELPQVRSPEFETSVIHHCRCVTVILYQLGLRLAGERMQFTKFAINVSQSVFPTDLSSSAAVCSFRGERRLPPEEFVGAWESPRKPPGLAQL